MLFPGSGVFEPYLPAAAVLIRGHRKGLGCDITPQGIVAQFRHMHGAPEKIAVKRDQCPAAVGGGHEIIRLIIGDGPDLLPVDRIGKAGRQTA